MPCCHSASARLQLYELCEGRGEHVHLQLPYSASDADMYKANLDAFREVPLPWYSVGAAPFRFPALVNILEAHALLSYIRLCVREARVVQRSIVVVELGIVKGTVRKCRSSLRGIENVGWPLQLCF